MTAATSSVAPDAAFRALLAGQLRGADGRLTRTLHVTGAPRSGKTRFALRAFMYALEAFNATDPVPDAHAVDSRGDVGERDSRLPVMVVSGRKAAERFSREVVRHRGVSAQARPVGTLPALAFRILARSRMSEGLPMPRLLNGAEQDALLRTVLGEHVRHAQRGDDCATCNLLRDYFARQRRWISVPSDPSAGGSNAPSRASAAVDTATLLAGGIGDEFIAQLRDMLARINELGLSESMQPLVLAALRHRSAAGDPAGWHNPDDLADGAVAGDRLGIEWRLAFALRREYVETITARYPGEFRLDSSRLMIEATQTLSRGAAVPCVVVVDDWQDVTLAGMALLQTLERVGAALALVGNSDESVQAFRGSYPEYLASIVERPPESADAHNHSGVTGTETTIIPPTFGRLGAAHAELPPRALTEERTSGHSFLDLLASRVSLAILGDEPHAAGVTRRPGKLPQWPGSSPITPLDFHDPLLRDGSVQTRLFRTPQEELDDVVWQIRHESLENGRDWNDMAVIAHDNATVRAFGERLRGGGVPVRYSSVTRPLRDEPSVRGLLSLVELAELRDEPDRLGAMPVERQIAWMRLRIRSLLASGLVAAVPDRAAPRPVHVDRLDGLASTVANLCTLADAGSDDVEAVRRGWQALHRSLSDSARVALRARTYAGVHVDNRVLEGAGRTAGETKSETDDAAAAAARMSPRAVCTVLLLGDKAAQHAVMAMLQGIVGGGDADVGALQHALTVIAHTSGGLRTAAGEEPRYALWAAWQACGVADAWQREALMPNHDGERANDRLDAMMRLFRLASDPQATARARRAGGVGAVDRFIADVRGMRIEADSLAHVGPIEHAVTLTTPAGAAVEATTWPVVWLPAVQQGVWPNLALRDTLFGADDLADLVLHGCRDAHVPARADVTGGHSTRLAATLHAEERSLLMAVTRATAQLRLSAAWNDDVSPSDFLYGFLPECYPRVADPGDARFTTVGSDETAKGYSGLDASARGLIAAARGVLARAALAEPLGGWGASGYTPTSPGETGPADETSPAVRDATSALRLLAAHGYPEADPSHWAFVHQEPSPASLPAEHPLRPVSGSAFRTVTLSPSAVDAIWQCPLEWLLGRQLNGPQPESVAMGFGTLIHRVAQQGTEENLDWPDPGAASIGVEERINTVAARLDEIYEQLAAAPAALGPADVRSSYDARRRRLAARNILRHIADYLVRAHRGNAGGYAAFGNKAVPVGALRGVSCEREFSARFDAADIAALWNRTFREHPVNRTELFALMDAVVGGFPEALTPEVSIRVTGRIDRLEDRAAGLTAGGRGEQTERCVWRIVDYKTGRLHAARDVFSDLQLVCYQLGLMFPNQTGQPGAGEPAGRDPAARRPSLPVSQAVLFDVSERPAPAYAHSMEEIAYQPALVADGRLNTAFAPRPYQPRLASLYAPPDLPAQAPAGVPPQLWHFVLSLRDSPDQQGLWAVDMIARVFFAAGVKLSANVADPRIDASHCRRAGKHGVCPAWENLHRTIMEDE